MNRKETLKLQRIAFYTELEGCVIQVCEKKCNLENQQAKAIADAITEFLISHFAGQVICFPKDYQYQLKKRDMEIFNKFTGSNYAELIQEYGITESGLRKALSRARKFLKQSEQVHQ